MKQLRVDTFGTGEVPEEKIEKAIKEVFDMSPAGIIKTLDRNCETAAEHPPPEVCRKPTAGGDVRLLHIIS